jgi:hypothetical protein
LDSHIRNPRTAGTVRNARAAEGSLHAGNVDLPGDRDHVLRRPVPGLCDLPESVRDRVRAGQQHAERRIGAANTAVLLCSSFTMVLAVRAAQIGSRKALIVFLILTILLGGIFLGVKAYEWNQKFEEHHVPGPTFHLEGVPPATRAGATVLLAVLHHDRAARPAHGDRRGPHVVSCCGMHTRANTLRHITRRWTSAGSTGTLSISSGSFCSRCSI